MDVLLGVDVVKGLGRFRTIVVAFLRRVESLVEVCFAKDSNAGCGTSVLL